MLTVTEKVTPRLTVTEKGISNINSNFDSNSNSNSDLTVIY